MKTAQLIIALVAALLLVGGCSHAGPFVTDVSFDGQGNMIVMKKMLVYSYWTATLETENEQRIEIKMPLRKE